MYPTEYSLNFTSRILFLLYVAFMNRNLKALTGKKSFAIDHLVFVLTTEREHIREEMRKVRKLLGE